MEKVKDYFLNLPTLGQEKKQELLILGTDPEMLIDIIESILLYPLEDQKEIYKKYNPQIFVDGIWVRVLRTEAGSPYMLEDIRKDTKNGNTASASSITNLPVWDHYMTTATLAILYKGVALVKLPDNYEFETLPSSSYNDTSFGKYITRPLGNLKSYDEVFIIPSQCEVLGIYLNLDRYSKDWEGAVQYDKETLEDMGYKVYTYKDITEVMQNPEKYYHNLDEYFYDKSDPDSYDSGYNYNYNDPDHTDESTLEELIYRRSLV